MVFLRPEKDSICNCYDFLLAPIRVNLYNLSPVDWVSFLGLVKTQICFGFSVPFKFRLAMGGKVE